MIEYRCYHCNQVFYEEDGSASEHFGCSMVQEPICTINAKRLRELEQEVDSLRRQIQEESTPLEREIASLRSEIATKERRAEEAGYARGLEDAKKYPETLGLIQLAKSNVAMRVIGNDGKLLGYTRGGELLFDRDQFKDWPSFVQSVSDAIFDLVPIDKESEPAKELIAKDNKRIAELNKS
jgi:hypothetical protein